MATRSSVLAWETPRTEEPAGLQSTGSQRVGHNCATHTHDYQLHQCFLPAALTTPEKQPPQRCPLFDKTWAPRPSLLDAEN